MKPIVFFIIGFLAISTTVSSQNVDINTLTQNTNELYLLNGKLYTGKVFAKHPNGTIGMVGEVKSGMKVGTWTFWYSTGEKKRQTTYINNKKEGLTYYWYQNGQIAKEIMYRDDKNIDQKLWDEKGNRKPNPSFDTWR